MNISDRKATGSPDTIALVTGCSSGIGRATALALARQGFAVWASARSVETLRELESAGCRTVRLDVTNMDSRIQAVSRIKADGGSIGLLVNNAGYSQPGAVEELPLDAYRAQFETNVFGLIGLCQLVLPGMRANGRGTIVNLGSGAGLVTPPLSSAYAMSKYALEAFSDSLRFETSRFGIRTILVEASAIKSSFTNTLEQMLPAQAGGSPYTAVTAKVLRFARYKVGSQVRIAPTARRLLGDRLWDAVMARLIRAE